MENLQELLNVYSQSHDFNKTLGTMAKSVGVLALHDYFKNERLRVELKKCDNLKQMQNVIQQLTGELTKPRSREEIQRFEENFRRLLKMARL